MSFHHATSDSRSTKLSGKNPLAHPPEKHILPAKPARLLTENEQKRIVRQQQQKERFEKVNELHEKREQLHAENAELKAGIERYKVFGMDANPEPIHIFSEKAYSVLSGAAGALAGEGVDGGSPLVKGFSPKKDSPEKNVDGGAGGAQGAGNYGYGHLSTRNLEHRLKQTSNALQDCYDRISLAEGCFGATHKESSEILLNQILNSRKKILLLRSYLTDAESRLNEKIQDKKDRLKKEVDLKHELAKHNLDMELEPSTIATAFEKTKIQHEISDLEPKLREKILEYHKAIVERDNYELVRGLKRNNLNMMGEIHEISTKNRELQKEIYDEYEREMGLVEERAQELRDNEQEYEFLVKQKFDLHDSIPDIREKVYELRDVCRTLDTTCGTWERDVGIKWEGFLERLQRGAEMAMEYGREDFGGGVIERGGVLIKPGGVLSGTRRGGDGDGRGLAGKELDLDVTGEWIKQIVESAMHENWQRKELSWGGEDGARKTAKIWVSRLLTHILEENKRRTHHHSYTPDLSLKGREGNEVKEKSRSWVNHLISRSLISSDLQQDADEKGDMHLSREELLKLANMVLDEAPQRKELQKKIDDPNSPTVYGPMSPERLALALNARKKDGIIDDLLDKDAEHRLLNPTEQRRQIRFLQRSMELLSETRTMEQSVQSLKERRNLLKKNVSLLKQRVGELVNIKLKLERDKETEYAELFRRSKWEEVT